MASGAKPRCLKKPSQLVVVGDSYLNWITHNFPDDFKKEFGGAYRMYAVGGASMASGGISGFIPDQFKMAISEDPDIVASVMTGGGNDILIADTTKFPGSDACKDRTDSAMQKVCQDVIAEAMKVAGELMQTAADAGVADVVYLYYPQIPGGGFGGMNPNVILSYSQPMARDMCERAVERTSGKLRCHFLDLQPVFQGHADWFADDGIHENEKGSAAMAKAVTQLLKDTCVAQPAESGCCVP
jgi:lysophospholipase L1-like esterase